MLPPFIIEQIRKREEESKRVRYEQPQLEVPRPDGPRPRPHQVDPEEEPGGSVIIVQL